MAKKKMKSDRVVNVSETVECYAELRHALKQLDESSDQAAPSRSDIDSEIKAWRSGKSARKRTIRRTS
jgi:hypothetical protein